MTTPVTDSQMNFLRWAVLLFNEPPSVAAFSGRHHVRGALDPAYADAASFDRYVQDLLSGVHEDTAALFPDNRVLVALSAIRGRVETTPDTPHPDVAWFRLLGRTRVEVVRESF